MSRYTITESVGNRVEQVNNYRDLEKHHPSSGRESGRDYQTINGELEEVRLNRTEPHVKKDFIIDPPTIPAPVSGTIRNLNDAFNTVQIVDNQGNVLAQALHMARGSQPANGSRIEYGQTLGRMGDIGSPGSVHAHVEAPAAVFERYINDITSGRIQSNGAAVANNAPNANNVPNANPMADGVLRRNEEGAAVKKLQEDLTKAGFSTQGADGKFGQNTEDALKRYQQSHGLQADGVAGPATLKALKENQPAQQAPTLQPTATPQPSNAPATEANANKTFLDKQSPEARAYLDLVAWKEVGKSLNADGSPAGYRERNGVPGSKGLMPESAIADNGKLPTDELRYNVGRYQMKLEDVKDMRDRYDKKIDDFSPESQDRIAVAKMKYRGVTEALESGDIRGAITKGGKEWASLPGSPYGQVQSGYTADQAVEYYNKRLAFHQAQDRGQTAPSQGETKPTQSQNTGAMADGLLKQGEKGEDVRKLQEALNKNGAKLDADGNFGPATKAAVESYQRSRNLDTDGVAGAKTLASLGMTQTQSAPVAAATQQTIQPTLPNSQQTNPAEKPQSTTTAPTTQTAQPQAESRVQQAGTLQQGDSGPAVKQLQEALAQHGGQCSCGKHGLTTDGQYGDITKRAIEQFQEFRGMPVTGVADSKTLTALGIDPQKIQATTQATTNPQPTQTDKPQTPANTQPAQSDKPLMSNPNHPDNKLYQQAVSNLEQLGPSAGFKSRDDLEKAAAAVTADAKATGLKEIDHISKTNAPNGQTYLVAVQGDPTSPAAKNSYIDFNQATSQTMKQSTEMADAKSPPTPAVANPTVPQIENQKQENMEQKPKTMVA